MQGVKPVCWLSGERKENAGIFLCGWGDYMANNQTCGLSVGETAFFRQESVVSRQTLANMNHKVRDCGVPKKCGQEASGEMREE